MKIAVFCSRKAEKELPRILELIKGMNISHVRIKDISPEKLALPKEQNPLRSCTHFFALLENPTDKANWLPLFYGISLFAPAQSCFIYHCHQNHSERILELENIGLFQEYKAIETGLNEIIQQWRKKTRISGAKKTLQEWGLEISFSSLLRQIEKGDYEAVELFLEAGFSPHSKSDSGVPLLSLAVRQKHLKVAQILIEKGADINTASQDRGNTPLMDAAAAGDIDCLNYLIENGAALDGQSKNGQSALILAAGQNHLDCAKRLLDAGANINLKDKLGMSVHQYSRLLKNKELEDLLRNYSSS